MRNTLLILALLIGIAVGHALPQGNDNKYNHVTFTPLPALQASAGQGVAAPFAGTLGDGTIVVAGGCNFPDRPAAQGGAKRFYDAVWTRSADAEQWQVAGRLPYPAAYGMSVSVGDGVVCIGGHDGQASHSDVFLLTLRNGQVAQQALPALPAAVEKIFAEQ